MSNAPDDLTFRQRIESDRFVIGAEVVTSRGFVRPQSSDKAVKLAEALAADPRIAWISVTDNPGGAPMLPPDWLAGTLAAAGRQTVVHLACKDLNRNGLESAAWRYAAEGCDNILALTGDYPATGFGGMTQPVFDLDSVSLIELLRQMNEGLVVPGRRGQPETLPATDFYIGCCVSPFKRLQRELIPQYFKLEKKIEAGAHWVLPQLGYDMRKFNEIKLYLESSGHDIPVIGNVYLLTRPVARLFNSGRLAGCVVSDELLADAEKYGAGPDKGRSFFRQLAAKQLAVFKGLGFAAGYLGGIAKADTFFEIIDIANSYGEDEWRDFLPEICYSLPDEFFLFEHDEKTGLSSPDQLNSEYVDSIDNRPKSKFVTMNYRVSRTVHKIAFTRGRGLYNMAARTFKRWDKKEKPGLLFRMAYLVERMSKRMLYGCHDCGDCSLPDIAYLCPRSSCSKDQRNGPCGGSRDGQCELEDKECIWTMAYERLLRYGESESLLDRPVVVCNPALDETSSWANTYCDRDHSAPVEEVKEETPETKPESVKEKPAEAATPPAESTEEKQAIIDPAHPQMEGPHDAASSQNESKDASESENG